MDEPNKHNHGRSMNKILFRTVCFSKRFFSLPMYLKMHFDYTLMHLPNISKFIIIVFILTIY